jgi:hypothetical protein
MRRAWSLCVEMECVILQCSLAVVVLFYVMVLSIVAFV